MQIEGFKLLPISFGASQKEFIMKFCKLLTEKKIKDNEGNPIKVRSCTLLKALLFWFLKLTGKEKVSWLKENYPGSFKP